MSKLWSVGRLQVYKSNAQLYSSSIVFGQKKIGFTANFRFFSYLVSIFAVQNIMEFKMKKVITALLLSIICFCSVLYAGHDVHITFQQLPNKAQQFIQEHFPNNKIAIAKKEIELASKSYDVIFTNGDKLEFGSNGNWTEIKCRNGAVPTAVIPQQILNYVNSTYPDNLIIEIERKRGYYEIKLSNRAEIKFDRRFNVIDIAF